MSELVRDFCAVTGSSDLEPLHCFPQFPVFMGCTAKSIDDDFFANMDWWISRSSGAIQLKETLPLDLLYPEQHQSGTIGSLWREHHVAFSNFLRTFDPKKVFEIGGAHGILAKEYCGTKNISWEILEPNPSPVEECPAKFIKGFFDENYELDEDIDVLVHSHVLEHIYDPILFFENLSAQLKYGTRIVFSVPNIEEMLKRKYNNGINFEHTIYLIEPYIEYLFQKNGFKLEAKQFFKADHSIFYSIIKGESYDPLPLQGDLYEKNKAVFADYINYHYNLVSELNRKISNYTGPVYLFGAHIFSQYLVAFGLETKKIVSILDNDPIKQGLRLYGSELLVESPSVLGSQKSPAVILKAGVYNAEIQKDIKFNINYETLFWD